MKNYFQLANSFFGEVYFRVSEHLGIPVSEVIQKKFTWDIKFLIMKHSQRLRAEIKQSKEFEDKSKEFSTNP